MIKKILIVAKTKKKYPIKDLNSEFHTNEGIISKKDLNSNKPMIKSSKGIEFFLIDPTYSDLAENFYRGPQIINQKDIGLILAKTGINHKSNIVDAGGGTGSLCFALANICKNITVYEINPEHYKILFKNQKLLDAKNVNLIQSSIYNGIKEKNLDLITLDLPEPWRVTEHAQNSLKHGGHLVVYLPNLTQVEQFLRSTKNTSIKIIEILELLSRNWIITEKICRPNFQMLGHTGFLIFCRCFKK